MSKNLIHTALPPDQCRDRIAASIDGDGFLDFGGFLGSKRVMGHVDDAGFQLQIRTLFRNSFKTILRGKFSPDAYGTSIELSPGINRVVKAAVGFWMTVIVINAFIYGILNIMVFLAMATTSRIVVLPPHAMIEQAVVALLAPFILAAFIKLGLWFARTQEAELKEFVQNTLG